MCISSFFYGFIDKKGLREKFDYYYSIQNSIFNSTRTRYKMENHSLETKEKPRLRLDLLCSGLPRDPSKTSNIGTWRRIQHQTVSATEATKLNGKDVVAMTVDYNGEKVNGK